MPFCAIHCQRHSFTRTTSVQRNPPLIRMLIEKDEVPLAHRALRPPQRLMVFKPNLNARPYGNLPQRHLSPRIAYNTGVNCATINQISATISVASFRQSLDERENESGKRGRLQRDHEQAIAA